MSEYSSSLLSLLTFVILFTLSAITFVYEEEQAAVRTVHLQVIKEMAGAGYLDPAVSAYYSDRLRQEGFDNLIGAFFTASHTDPMNRALKPVYSQVDPHVNFVHLETRVKPSFSTEIVNWLRTGNGDFLFRNDRESQYIPFLGG
ncbi:hypothetical protein P9G84_13760 [Brevibacillus centrosporus]|uniref:hypothetical protein n=1 Tax=Brevibacillus centrosporus TaxID=54910 RepID=UPI001144DF27|nr:hypothetical protein [Brevibacillus centrosporus]MEC2130009.1 hypothetical protein [Brevibacillus centrosporus]GED32388.1 hypothetical protein BCE02nite_35290 [Brevibacillus centrosporus]